MNSYAPTMKWVLLLAIIGFGFGFANAKECSVGYDCTGECNSTIILPCGPGYYCNGVDPVSLCPSGYYCDNGGTQKHECPKGKLCPPGSAFYLECGTMSMCGTMYGKSFNIGALILLIVFNIGFLILLIIRKRKLAISTSRLERDSINIDHYFNASEEEDSDLLDKSRNDISFVFENVQAEVRGNCFSKSKQILQDVSGHFRTGRITGIMGPSGAGKTSLLNVLLGKVKLSSGSISINGLNNKETTSKIRDITGFVPQDDIMMESLTVHDVLMHSALLNLPPKMALSQKENIVDMIISVLGLSHVRNSTIGGIHVHGISGGEKKRVNIGLELVKQPRVLFLDEPTSGLDSANALSVFNHLSKITVQNNLMTVAILHQPRYDIFQLCDDILLLGKGGRSIYSGPRNGVLAYFENIGYRCPATTNPADFLLDIISNFENTDSLVDNWLSSSKDLKKLEKDSRSDREDPDLSILRRERTGFFMQLSLFFKRAAKQVMASLQMLFIDCLIHTFGGIVIGIGFVTSPSLYVPPIPYDYVPFCPEAVRSAFCEPAVEDKLARFGIYIVMGLGVATGTVAVRTFWFERLVYWREASGGASRLAYFTAKNLIDIPLIFLNGFVFTCALLLVASPLGNLGKYLLAFLLYQFCIYAVGYICTWISELPALLTVVVALLLGLGTGGVSSVKNMGFGADLSWSRWVGEAVFLTETENYVDPSLRNLTNNYMEARYGYVESNYSHDIWALLVTGIALRSFAFFLQCVVNKDKQK